LKEGRFQSKLAESPATQPESMNRLIIVSPCEHQMRKLSAAFCWKTESEVDLLSCEVNLCSTPTEAMQVYGAIHPDVVLIDSSIGLSQANLLVSEIRRSESERHTGIILLIADDLDRKEAVSFLENGADEFFSKDAEPREIRARVNAVLRLKATADRLRSVNHRLEILSNTDELTGLANMRQFYRRYAEAMLSCRDGRLPVGIIMFDLDHFKRVNDSTNHLIGSFVIGEVGKIVRLAGILSNHDVPARYGGDEYIIMTHDIDINATVRKAEMLRSLIEAAHFSREGVSMRLTASMGVAWAAPGFGGAADDLMKAADLMCYRSKKSGRNCVSSIKIDETTDLNQLTDDASKRVTMRFDLKRSTG
jgi:diguanylate cyclase (GGDEF)-like protein